MFDIQLIKWGIAAAVVLVVMIGVTIWYHCCSSRAKRPFTAMQVLVFGVFAAMVVQYFPILRAETGGSVWEVLALTMYRAFRIFLTEGDWESTIETLKKIEDAQVATMYRAVCSAELVVMPMLTAGFVLSFFSGLAARLQYMFSWFCPTFVFSKLNAQSLAFAKSVRAKYPMFATLVFTDVYYEHGDDGYELLCAAKDLRAICLRQDITHLKFGLGWWKKVTCLIMGEYESESLAQAIDLNERLKKRRHTAVYVYASSVGSGYVIDSLDKGELLIPPPLKRGLSRDLDTGNKSGNEMFDALERRMYASRPSDGYTISRIDSVHNTVLDTFADTKMNVFRLCKQKNTNVVSLLILGMGTYGKQIFKTALWFCQMNGYKLEINVVDSGKDKNGNERDIETVLRHECPEILSGNGLEREGEAHYDIRFFKNVNCFDGTFDALFANTETAERLKRTVTAFVALGDDDKNIEAAITLRKMFDRLYALGKADYEALKDEKLDLPRIYAVVYDDRKAQNLNMNKNEKVPKISKRKNGESFVEDQQDDSYLVDYRNTPYHIHFIGNLSSQYSYDALERMEETERRAFSFHLRWSKMDKILREAMKLPKNAEVCQKILKTEGKSSVEEIGWDDLSLENETPEKQQEKLLNKIADYKRFEYYRFSSVAQAAHAKIVESDLFAEQSVCLLKKEENLMCECANCNWRRETGHKRWNAYARVQGYRYGEKRADRAQVHDALVPTAQVYWKNRYKD